MILRTVLLSLSLAGTCHAQTVREAPGAELRWLDRISGETADVQLSRGQSAVWGRLTVQLNACRAPRDEGASDAYAHLIIRDSLADKVVFSGWMIAAAPALSALDHPRYDVWLLRCLSE